MKNAISVIILLLVMLQGTAMDSKSNSILDNCGWGFFVRVEAQAHNLVISRKYNVKISFDENGHESPKGWGIAQVYKDQTAAYNAWKRVINDNSNREGVYLKYEDHLDVCP